MELRGDAVVGTLMRKPRHHRCLRIAPRLDRNAGGVPCRGFAPIGGNSERRAEFRPFAKDDRCSALADPDRLHAGGGDHGDPRRRGDASREGVDKGVVGNVEAKRFEPGFMGIEFDFGCPKQPAGVVDQSDRFQRLTDVLQPVPHAEVSQEFYRSCEEGGRPPVAIEPTRPMRPGSQRDGNISRRQRKSGSKTSGTASDDDH